MRPAFFVAAAALAVSPLAGQEPARPRVVGTWDLTLTAPDGRALPSWLEVHVSGRGVLVGRFVGVVGSVRPISRLTYANDTLRFSLPPQWEAGDAAAPGHAAVGCGAPAVQRQGSGGLAFRRRRESVERRGRGAHERQGRR